jgi:hypothetical protein
MGRRGRSGEKAMTYHDDRQRVYDYHMCDWCDQEGFLRPDGQSACGHCWAHGDIQSERCTRMLPRIDGEFEQCDAMSMYGTDFCLEHHIH